MDQSASAAGQASAFTAQADDASAVYYNPAGMTQLRGVQTSFGVLFLGGSTSYTSPTGTTARGDFGSSVVSPPPLNLYAAVNFRDLGIKWLGDLSAGLAVVSPFGLKYRYPDTASFNTPLPFNAVATQESLELIDIKPTLAYKLSDQLSIGIGADIYTLSSLWGEGQYQYQTMATGVGLPVPPGTRLELNGKDTALGFNASFLFTPLRNAEGKPLVNLGFIYRSQATLQLDGALLANGASVGNTSSTMVLPQVFTGGLAVWPFRNQDHEWKLEVDVDYTGWKSFRNTDIHLTSGPLAGQTIPYPRNWRNTYTVMVGTEYKWLRPAVLPYWEIAFRGGYWHGQSAVPDITFSPTVPDSESHSVTAGLGFLCKGQGHFLGLFQCGGTGVRPKAVGIDVAYKALIYEVRTITGSNHFLSGPTAVDGRYNTVFHGGFVNLRVNF